VNDHTTGPDLQLEHAVQALNQQRNVQHGHRNAFQLLRQQVLVTSTTKVTTLKR
jgi:hypothetical protein